jgi:hypothetical protein
MGIGKRCRELTDQARTVCRLNSEVESSFGSQFSTDGLPVMQRQNRAYPSESSMVVVHSRTPVRITEHLQTPSYAASH